MQSNAPRGRTGEQEPGGPGHRTNNTTQRACAPVNRSQVARIPHIQHDPLSRHTGEREPSGPGHRTLNTTNHAGTPGNRSQVAQDTAHAKQHIERAHR